MDSFYTFLFAEAASTETFIVAVAVAALFLFLRKRWREGAALALGAAGMGLTVWALKVTLQVPRMPGGLLPVDSYAFPSGHAAAAMFLGVVAVLYLMQLRNPWHRYGLSAAALGAALGIGASRVIFAVHTPLQVIAGFAIGALWGIATHYAMRRFHR